MGCSEKSLEESCMENDSTKLERELEGKNSYEISYYFRKRFKEEKKLIPRDTMVGMCKLPYTKMSYARITKIMSTYFKGVIEPIVLKLLEDNKERLYRPGEVADILELGEWDKHASISLSAHSKQKESSIIYVMGRKYREYKYSETCSEAKRRQHKDWKSKGFCFANQCGTDECPKVYQD